MIESGSIAALILAAGYSSRMGKLKPLLPLGRSTVIEEAIKRFRDAGIEDIRVVTGHGAEEIAPVLNKLRVRVIFNAEYDKGMLSSVLAGLSSFDADTGAFFLLPADIPLVKPATISSLVRAHRSSNAQIIYPRFEGLRGHPPLVSTACVTEIPKECEGGFRAFLDRYESQSLDLDVIDESILMDCDTPEDYRKLQAYEQREDIPTERECKALWTRYGPPENPDHRTVNSSPPFLKGGQGGFEGADMGESPLPSFKKRRRNFRREDLVAHCRTVAEIARILAVYLNRKGFNLDVDLVAASGYLHDLAKGLPDHAHAAAHIFEVLGYGRVARIVASHRDIRLEQFEQFSLDESCLVYLADKLVQRDRIVTLEERFKGSLIKYAHKPDILEAVGRRFKDAQTIKNRIEEVLGVSVEKIIQNHKKGIQEVSTGERRKIYLVRHGAIQHPVNGKCYIGQMDLPLSAEGIRQAEALRDRLSHIPLTAIYCSDLRRSVETAQIIGEPHGLELCVNKDLREIDLGKWEGLPFDEVRQKFPEEYRKRGQDIVHFRPPGGESFLDCACRVLPSLYKALHSTQGNILIVGHAGVNRILLCQAMGKSMDTLFDIDQHYGCLNVIRYSDSAFELEMVNETPQVLNSKE